LKYEFEQKKMKTFGAAAIEVPSGLLPNLTHGNGELLCKIYKENDPVHGH
jgi:hypothetical protein